MAKNEKKPKVYEIVKYPDPVLAKRGQPVTVFDDKLRQLVEDMFESMYEPRASALPPRRSASRNASPSSTRASRRTLTTGSSLLTRRLSSARASNTREEGCLSLPDIRDKVKRAAKVKVRAQDVSGEWFENRG